MDSIKAIIANTKGKKPRTQKHKEENHLLMKIKDM
jgi:hypothetical protein